MAVCRVSLRRVARPSDAQRLCGSPVSPLIWMGFNPLKPRLTRRAHNYMPDAKHAAARTVTVGYVDGIVCLTSD